MRIVVEVTHPAHVHFYRNPIQILWDRGHDVLVTSRDKDCTLNLLNELDIPHECLSRAGHGSAFSMLNELIYRDLALYRVLKYFQADVVAGVGGTSAAHAGLLAGCPSVLFYDTEEARLQNIISYPFAARVVTPKSYTGWTPQRKTSKYSGYHELSYLHPRYFSPDRHIALANGLAPHGDTFLIRLVSWKANHDYGLKGWDEPTLRGVVQALASKGRVLISSESDLPPEFAPLQYPGSHIAIHHLMGHCRLVVGESATMASEAVAMGVPAIYAAPSYRGYITHQQDRHGMAAYIARPSSETIVKAAENFLDLSPDAIKSRYEGMLQDGIDVPAFIADTIEGVAV